MLNRSFFFIPLVLLLFSGCGSGSASDDDTSDNSNTANTVDLKDIILTETSADCADYVNSYTASVMDEQRSISFTESVTISVSDNSCTLTSNSIPNHDFNDNTANFATNVAEVSQSLSIPRNPGLASSSTALAQQQYDAIMINGVVLDILSAGCYNPSSNNADGDGNTPVGCHDGETWLLDPLGTYRFGTDSHNAHTQPNGLYHYHGNPNALFDDNPGPSGSPVIGFAADGFPIYGSYFLDSDSGTVRKAVSGYTLKNGSRPGPDASNPGGNYDGTYNNDYEFTNVGDLDPCNGMMVNGQYGYYVTDTYPWVIKCFSGTPDSSFGK